MYPSVAKPSVALAVTGKAQDWKGGVTVRFGSPGWEGDSWTGGERGEG